MKRLTLLLLNIPYGRGCYFSIISCMWWVRGLDFYDFLYFRGWFGGDQFLADLDLLGSEKKGTL